MSNIGILKKTGFSKTTFSETILTIDCIEKLYSTPIGFKLVNDELIARIYRITKIYELITSKDCDYCLCIARDPVLFYRAVLDRESLKYRYVEKFEKKCIDGCDLYVYLVKNRVIDRKEYCLAVFKPLDIVILNKYPRVYRRVDYAIIEALIYLTKIPYVDTYARFELFMKINWCREVIYRSSRSRLYRELINNIVEKAENYLE